MFDKPARGFAGISACAALALSVFGAAPVSADPYLGEIVYAGFNFAPTGWAQCNGQILAINTNTALFSLLGTQFGGNGTSTFALPDMQGRAPLGQGQGPGLTPRAMGETGGSTSVTLLSSNIPAHTHSVNIATGHISASSAAAASAVPTAHALANTGRNSSYNAAVPDVTLAGTATLSGNTGLGGSVSPAPVAIIPPFLTVNCIIAINGIFPPRQ